MTRNDARKSKCKVWVEQMWRLKGQESCHPLVRWRGQNLRVSKKNSNSLRNHSTILVCELKCLLKASPAPAFQQTHICHFSFALPSILFVSSWEWIERNLLNKWRSWNSWRFFTGEKISNLWILATSASMSHFHINYFCVHRLLQKPTGCSTYNHNVIHSVRYSFIYSLLSVPFIFLLPDVCFFEPIVTFHLSPSNKTFTKRTKEKQHLVSLPRAQHISGSINV